MVEVLGAGYGSLSGTSHHALRSWRRLPVTSQMLDAHDLAVSVVQSHPTEEGRRSLVRHRFSITRLVVRRDQEAIKNPKHSG